MIDQEEIHNQCLSKNPNERIKALNKLEGNFSQLPDKQKAWCDLIKLTSDEDIYVRYRAGSALGSVFSDMPDKQKAWNDLHKLTSDENRYVRSEAASTLGSVFSQVPDKQQAWDDSHKLTNDEDSEVRSRAAYALGSAFSDVPDKQQAWNVLHKLANDASWSVRSSAASALGSAFSDVPDKQQAWNDLHKLTIDEDSSVRSSAASAIDSVFFGIPDKQQAWNDLHKLANDASWSVRFYAASALGSAFSLVPDKQQAWNDLHRLTNDLDSSVRSSAAIALGSAFSLVSDKQQAWNDLHKLTLDDDIEVRGRAAVALGSAFSHVPDKQQAWNDLHRLTSDKDNYVRTFSNHSLGRVSIFMASQAETDEDYKKELEKAIEYFEKAAQDSPKGDNPSKFCLPFYRSFHTVIFKKQAAKEEVDKYLAEAKDAIEGSKSKETLLEAVENLANALKEVQSIENLDLEAKKGELNFYRQYCDHAAELMRDTDEKAPFATEVLRKSLPILDRKLKEILEEIQKKTKYACRELQGTHNEEIVCTIERKVQKLFTSNPEESAQNIEDIAYTLKNQVPNIPDYILNKIDLMISENDLTKKTQILGYVILNVIGQMLKENQAPIKIDGNENNVIVNSKDSSIHLNTENKSGFIDSFATRASFLGFIVLELLNFWRPLSNTNHIVCLLAIVIFFFFAYIIKKDN
ncbi:MAG: HEAT repeat domain-containing protein [Methanosarcina sp.]